MHSPLPVAKLHAQVSSEAQAVVELAVMSQDLKELFPPCWQVGYDVSVRSKAGQNKPPPHIVRSVQNPPAPWLKASMHLPVVAVRSPLVGVQMEVPWQASPKSQVAPTALAASPHVPPEVQIKEPMHSWELTQDPPELTGATHVPLEPQTLGGTQSKSAPVQFPPAAIPAHFPPEQDATCFPVPS